MDSKNQESMFDKLFNSGKTLFEDISKKVRQSDFFKQGTCYICGKPLIGIYYKDLYGRKICTSHQRRTCISCGGFCNDSAMEISPGKYLCTHCQHYRTSLADAKHIIKLIRKHYLSIGLGEISRFHLEMVGLEDLQRLMQTSGDILGCAKMTGRRFDIEVLRHLSHTAMAGVLAHEILHIWQYQRGIFPPQDVCEGFCNLGSYELYKTIGSPHAKAKIVGLDKDPNPIYGEGYRKIKRYYDKEGWSGVIRKMEGYVQ